jgi:D-aspartate ligase
LETNVSQQSAAARHIQGPQDVSAHLVPVVLGADILGYSYVRCFHEAYGISSIVLASADVKVVSSSRFADYRVVEGIDQEDTLVAYLMELGAELEARDKVGILVGSGDWYARILSEHKDELMEHFVVPYIDFALLDEITQKERFYAICEELGIPYPQTRLFDCADPTATLDLEGLSFPCIAKPSNSARYHYAEFEGKKKVFEVESAEELELIFERLKASNYDRELVVQEFIPGDDDGLRSITLYADETGEVRLSAMGRVVLQDHAPSAIGNPVCILGEFDEQAVEDASRFLAHVGYHGYANFDAKYDPRDGRYKFFEVNTRPGRNTYYVTLGGVNFVTPLVDDFVLGLPIEKARADKPFVYACVPAQVVRKTVKDVELRDKVLAMYHDGLALSPLDYAYDTAVHQFWASVTYYHQIQKFKKYVWDTGGKQAAAD